MKKYILLPIIFAFFAGSACIQRSIDINQLEDDDGSGLLNLISTDLNKTLTRMGMTISDVIINAEEVSENIGFCSSVPYTTHQSIINRRSVIGSDPQLKKIFCKQGALGMVLSQYCNALALLANDSPAVISKRLTYDLTYWRSVTWINMLYVLAHSNTIPRGVDGLNSSVSNNFLVLLRSTLVDQLLVDHKPVDTVFIGDSIIHFAEAAISPFEFKNSVFLGITGERTDGLYYRIFDQVFRLRPKNVVISIGGNDFKQGCTDDDIRNNRERIILALKAMGVENIYFLSFPPLAKTNENKFIFDQNNRILELTLKFGINYIDVYRALSSPVGTVRPEYYLDGTHYNTAAYQRVVELLHQAGLN